MEAECKPGCHSGDYHYLIVGLSECGASLPAGTSVCFQTKMMEKAKRCPEMSWVCRPSSCGVAPLQGAGQVWVLGHGTAQHPPRNLEAKFVVSNRGLIYLVVPRPEGGGTFPPCSTWPLLKWLFIS